MALLFPLDVAEAEQPAQTVPRWRIMHYFAVFSRRLGAGEADLDVATRARNIEIQVCLQRMTFKEVPDRVAIIGTLEHCIERVRWLQQEF